MEFVGLSTTDLSAGTHEITAAMVPDAQLVLIAFQSTTNVGAFETLSQNAGGGVLRLQGGPNQIIGGVFRTYLTALWYGSPADLPATFTVSIPCRLQLIGYNDAEILLGDGLSWPSPISGSIFGSTIAGVNQFPVSPTGSVPSGKVWGFVQILHINASPTPAWNTSYDPTQVPTVTQRAAGSRWAVADDLNREGVPARGGRYLLGGTHGWFCQPIILVGDPPPPGGLLLGGAFLGLQA